MAVDHDRLFKELITTFFEEFLLLFFPHVHEHIDFQHVSFLSEELFTDVTAGEKYRVDLLVETKLKGEDSLIIVHIENQSYVQPSFPERMFIYFSRLFENTESACCRLRYLATTIFAMNLPRLRSNSRFSMYSNSDFLLWSCANKTGRDYIRHDNPIAAALLSKMGYTESERVELKKQFLRMIVRMELDEAKQRLLIGFFETYVKLSDEEEQQLRNEVNEMETKEKEQVLELIISYEKKALEKGLKEGLQQEKRHIAKKMLEKGYDVQTIHELTELSVEEIERLK
ncbi:MULTISPECIES: Rpn family recombination-promoting nuclease/putative transposase [Anoxybacillus]|nr:MULTISPECIES: Rpn family recombination-promoting nuclease/putative transposase [Anoxybacillus]